MQIYQKKCDNFNPSPSVVANNNVDENPIKILTNNMSNIKKIETNHSNDMFEAMDVVSDLL